MWYIRLSAVLQRDIAVVQRQDLGYLMKHLLLNLSYIKRPDPASLHRHKLRAWSANCCIYQRQPSTKFSTCLGKKKKTTNQPQTSKQMNITPARLRKPGTPYLSCHQYQLRIHLKKDWPPELLSTAQSCSSDVKPTENGSWSCGKDGMSTEPCRHLEASQPYSRTRQDLMLCHLHFCGFRIFSNLLKGNTDKQLTQIHPDSSWAQPVPVSPAISCQFCPFPYPEFCV